MKFCPFCGGSTSTPDVPYPAVSHPTPKITPISVPPKELPSSRVKKKMSYGEILVAILCLLAIFYTGGAFLEGEIAGVLGGIAFIIVLMVLLHFLGRKRKK